MKDFGYSRIARCSSSNHLTPIKFPKLNINYVYVVRKAVTRTLSSVRNGHRSQRTIVHVDGYDETIKISGTIYVYWGRYIFAAVGTGVEEKESRKFNARSDLWCRVAARLHK